MNHLDLLYWIASKLANIHFADLTQNEAQIAGMLCENNILKKEGNHRYFSVNYIDPKESL